MPKIQEYVQNSEVPGAINQREISPNEFGIGQGIQALGQGITEGGNAIQRRIEQDEVSGLNVKMAEAQAKWTGEQRSRLQNGSLQADEFVRELDEDVSKIGDELGTATGRRAFNESKARLQNHFTESAAVGQAELSGAKAKDNVIKSLSARSSSVLSDPSQFALSVQEFEQEVDGLVKSEMLPSVRAAELKQMGRTDLAQNAVRGWTDLDPNDAKEQLKSGLWDQSITGDLKHQLTGEAEREIRGREVDADRQRLAAKRAIAEQQTATQNDFLDQLHKGTLTWDTIKKSKLDPFGSGSKDTFMDMIKQGKEARIKSDPHLQSDLFDRIHADDDDPKKIWDENDLNQYYGKGLDLTAIRALRSEIQGKGTAEGKIENDLKKGVMAQAKKSLVASNPMMGIQDPEGQAQYQKFQNYFLTEYPKQRKAGKTPEELLNPDSPSYLGNQIKQFTRSPQQIMQGLTKGMKPQAAPVSPEKVRKPGETLEQWRARTK